MKRPILAITMGDPASIGPELCIKALMKEDVYKKSRPIIIGDLKVLNEAISLLDLEDKILTNPIQDIKEAKFTYGIIDVLDMDLVDIESLQVGRVSKQAGEASFQYVKKAIDLAMSGEVDGTVTNAINKEAINLAGYQFSGHTEIYAEYTGTKDYSMLLIHGNLRVIHVSTHVSLRQACDLVKKERIYKVIKMANEICLRIGIPVPKIGVAGLNPHSGENGLFGYEEIEEIIPGINKAKKENIDVKGPISPDVMFSQALAGWYDIVVAMYHDQGHIPIKTQGFVYGKTKDSANEISGINVTLGLPILRVSVDHGTAFDRAGMGTSDESSLLNAIDFAAEALK